MTKLEEKISVNKSNISGFINLGQIVEKIRHLSKTKDIEKLYSEYERKVKPFVSPFISNEEVKNFIDEIETNYRNLQRVMQAKEELGYVGFKCRK